jgi:hypothetical protein
VVWKMTVVVHRIQLIAILENHYNFFWYESYEK